MKTIATKAADLINKHLDYDTLRKHTHSEEALIKAYKTAEQELMTYVGVKAKSANSIPELVNCFYYSCYGFEALGRRADFLEGKLIGTQKTPAESLDDAIHKGVDIFPRGIPDSFPYFDPLPKIGDGLLHDWYTPDQTDWKALAAMPLLDYLTQGDFDGLKLNDLLSDLTYGSCLSRLLEYTWRKRSLVGYYDVDFVYKPYIADKTFIKTFSNTLTRLLDKGATLDSIQIREHMHHLLLKGWSDHHLPSTLTFYADIEKIISKHKSHEALMSEFIGTLVSYVTFAVKKSYRAGFVGYELDYQGLESLAEMLRDLGLDTLQGARQYIEMVEGLSA